MKARSLPAAIVLICLLMARLSFAQEAEKPMLVHTHNEFAFTVHAPMEKTFPLFGAIEEKKWAEGWEPEVLYPSPAKDQLGMVFRVAHPHMSSVWTCTAFDPASGHVQYVYYVSDALVTSIDIHLTQSDNAETHVSVLYERTALTSGANEHVALMAQADAHAGPHWAEMINKSLGKMPN